MTTAFIDADIVAFRAAAGASGSFDFGDGEKAVSSDPEKAIASALETVQSWMSLSKCKDVLCCFSGVHNFRKLILPSYKSHRKGGKPPDYWAVVEAVTERFPTRVVDGLEADDVMGILATTERWLGESVVVTLDKDLRTVPGVHFNPLKDTRPVRVTEAEADYWWLTQTLTGDSTDGYKGIPRCGPAKALKILGAALRWPTGTCAAALWPRVLQAYRQASLTEADALQQARVARILRRCDYQQETRSILLWHPTSPIPMKLSAWDTAAGPQTPVLTEAPASTLAAE